MSELSLEALPSTARPTGTSSLSISGTRAMPEPRRMLDEGQWATPVWVRCSRASSSSLKWMPWAYHTSSPSQPSRSIRASGRQPYCSRQ